MAKFEVDLNDTKGTPAEFGDTVRVVLPRIDRPAINEFDTGFHLPGRTVEGILGFRLSQGIVVKITAVIDNNEGDGGDDLIGRTIPLRYTVRDWLVMAT